MFFISKLLGSVLAQAYADGFEQVRLVFRDAARDSVAEHLPEPDRSKLQGDGGDLFAALFLKHGVWMLAMAGPASIGDSLGRASKHMTESGYEAYRKECWPDLKLPEAVWFSWRSPIVLLISLSAQEPSGPEAVHTT